MKEFNTYNELIEYFKDKEISGYKEKHHIIPAYKGGTNDNSNLIFLPVEYHLLAHILLAKESTNNKDKNLNLLAAQLISNQAHTPINKIEELLKDKDYVKNLKYIRENANSFKRAVINNGIQQKNILLEELEEYLEKGWKKGMLKENIEKSRQSLLKYFEENGTSICSHKISEETKIKISNGTKLGMKKAKEAGKQIGHKKGEPAPNKGKKYITNGEINKIWPEDKELPSGWRWGQTQHHNKKCLTS